MAVDPTLAYVKVYLGTDTGWDEADISLAYAAELEAQKAVCKVPESGGYPEDLAEALCRRVAHNLAVRAVPLGVQASVSEFNATQIRVGGTDPEVRRLEAPYRKRVVG